VCLAEGRHSVFSPGAWRRVDTEHASAASHKLPLFPRNCCAVWLRRGVALLGGVVWLRRGVVEARRGVVEATILERSRRGCIIGKLSCRGCIIGKLSCRVSIDTIVQPWEYLVVISGMPIILATGAHNSQLKTLFC
jgi:hypothetical protein